jgi:REP-associated tyrosine transposase
VCAELDVDLVEFTGETDHVHLLVAYPPTPAI